LAKKRINELGIKKLVLASTTGKTAIKAMEFFKDMDVKLIVVPHQYDFSSTKENNLFPRDLVMTLRNAGHEVHFGTMLFHTGAFYGSTHINAMANLLYCFGQGVKVCFEIVLMAADAGLVITEEQILAIAGTAKGADTAMVIEAGTTQHIKNLKVNEILCKPLHP
jgi:hypothetical protein